MLPAKDFASPPLRTLRIVKMSTAVYSPDDQLMIRLQEGDSTAFDELVQEWQGPLHGFFRRNIRDEHLSEDLVQETLLRMYRNSWDYLPKGMFRGFLFRIARNLLIDHSRRAVNDVLIGRVGSMSVGEDGEFDLLTQVVKPATPVDQIVVQREIAHAVHEFLQDQPEEQRQTFLLHHYSGLTLAEVADAMQTSLPTAKSRLRLIREKLRHMLHCRGYADDFLATESPEEI